MRLLIFHSITRFSGLAGAPPALASLSINTARGQSCTCRNSYYLESMAMPAAERQGRTSCLHPAVSVLSFA
jgi:hypothetical protein